MSNEYKDWLADLTPTQRSNYALCMQWSILIPHDKIDDSNWEYDYTMLDDMPDGWRKAFGNQFADDLQQAYDLLPDVDKDRVYIKCLKEKYGYLHIYLSAYNPVIREVCKKYEQLSRKVCIHCGESATRVSTDWISPWCDTCAEKINDRTVSLEEWYKDHDHEMIE